MSVQKYDSQNKILKLIAGGTLFADCPVGIINAYGGASAPEGYLLCDGAAVSRTDYADLFSVIGTAFGAGDGSTTFNVPDMRECVPKGAGLYGGTVGAHLDADGLAVGEFLDDRVQEHQHKASNNANFYITGNTASMSAGSGITYSGSNITNTQATGRYGATTEVKSVGVNYIIKAKQSAIPADFLEALDDMNLITYGG